MTQKQFAALLGFAFAAAWISFNFGYALLCLVAAGAFEAHIYEVIAAGTSDEETAAVYAQAAPPDQQFLGLDRYWRKREQD